MVTTAERRIDYAAVFDYYRLLSSERNHWIDFVQLRLHYEETLLADYIEYLCEGTDPLKEKGMKVLFDHQIYFE